MTVLEYLMLTFTPGKAYTPRKWIICNDGFTMSVQGGHRGYYCTPCPMSGEDNVNEYETVECGYPSKEEPLIMRYAENSDMPCETVYGYVPIGIVELVVEKHGGINILATAKQE